MKVPAIGLLVTVLLFASGCASHDRPPPLPDEEWDAAHNRHYENLTQAEFYAAAEEVFRLADGGDFEFEYDLYEKNQLVAKRSFFVFAIFVVVGGQDEWYLRAIPNGTGIDGNARMFRKERMSDGSLPVRESKYLIRSVAALTMFWGRMDYVLGRSDHWPTCDEFEAMYENETNPNRSALGALCNMTMKDVDPRTGEAGNEEQEALEE